MAKAQQVLSPKGELCWVFITGKGRENKQNGVVAGYRYSASVRLKKDGPEHKELEAAVMAYWDENKPPKVKKIKSWGIKPELDAEGEETGFVLAQFWTATTFPDGKPKTVQIFNAKGKEVSLGNKRVGNGTIGYLSGAMGIYESDTGSGVTLYLNAVQITKFEEYKGSALVAQDEEDGWTGDDEDWEGEDADNGKEPDVKL